MSNSSVQLVVAVWVVSCWAIAAGADDAATAANPGGKVNTAVHPRSAEFTRAALSSPAQR